MWMVEASARAHMHIEGHLYQRNRNDARVDLACAPTYAVDVVHSGSPGIVIVSGIQFASTCAHHLLPITGVATVAYRPDEQDGLVVGLSKLSRLFDGYARRLQVQEQLGSQTVDSLVEMLRPVGAAAVISAEHGCMTMRGVQQPGTLTTTVATGGQWCAGHPDMEWVLGEHWRSPRLAK